MTDETVQTGQDNAIFFSGTQLQIRHPEVWSPFTITIAQVLLDNNSRIYPTPKDLINV